MPASPSELRAAHAPPCRDARDVDPQGRGEGGLGAAFDAAFAAVDPSFQGRVATTWSSRYVDHPLGAPAVVAVDRNDGSVQAHWGALAVPARFEGEAHTLGHVVDTFSATTLNRARRARAFQAACEAFVDRHCGPRAPRFPLCYGMPVRPAWRLGRARLGYEVLQSVWRLERDATHRAPSLPDGLRVEVVPRLDDHDTALFDRVAAERAVTTTRPAAWLAWRFDTEHDPALRLLRVWRADEAVAWGVLRVTTFEGERVLLVFERVAAADDAEARAALDGEALRRAAEAGVERVVHVCAEPSPELARLQAAGWVARASKLALVGRAFGRARDVDAWGRHLIWTLTDTDLA